MMGTVVHLKMKKKEVPRGPRGGIILKAGQTWCHNPSGEKVIIRKLGEKDERGKQRVWFSKKHSQGGYGRDLAEMTFRSNYFEESEWIKFTNETWQKWREHAKELGASDGIYRLFDQPTPSELLSEVSLRKRQPVPKRGELWRSNLSGKKGPWICLIKQVTRGDSQDPGYCITFVMRGGWGVQPCDDFRKEHTRIGWLGE